MMMLASFGGVLWISLLNEDPPLLVPVVCYLVALFAGCMVCHGEVVLGDARLVLEREPPQLFI